MTKISRDGRRVAEWYDESGFTRREALLWYVAIGVAYFAACAGLTWLAGVLL